MIILSIVTGSSPAQNSTKYGRLGKVIGVPDTS